MGLKLIVCCAIRRGTAGAPRKERRLNDEPRGTPLSMPSTGFDTGLRSDQSCNTAFVTCWRAAAGHEPATPLLGAEALSGAGIRRARATELPWLKTHKELQGRAKQRNFLYGTFHAPYSFLFRRSISIHMFTRFPHTATTTQSMSPFPRTV